MSQQSYILVSTDTSRTRFTLERKLFKLRWSIERRLPGFLDCLVSCVRFQMAQELQFRQRRAVNDDQAGH